MFTAILIIIAQKWENPNVHQLKNESTQFSIFTEWNDFCLLKGIKYWYTLQYGSMLKTLCYVKEASLKTPHIIWLNLHEISRICNSVEIENRLMAAWENGE